MKKLISDTLNHTTTAAVTPIAIAGATPTHSTFDVIIKVAGILLGLIPTIKQLFSKQEKPQ